MRDQLVGLLEQADLAVGAAADVLDVDLLAPLIADITAVRTRLAYPDDVLVVALAGGTGSGKSSLFNALVGEELVDVGGVRPTTSSPAAAAPRSAGSAMDGYLDMMGIGQRFTHGGPGLCLIDLPDTDSVEVEHRHRVDSILPLVDVVVWVTDPEKYRDARLHHDYLSPMAAYADQFVFVLNQADRLGKSQVVQVMADLARALREDGIPDPTVIAVSAAPPSGPPAGLEDLWVELESKRSDRNVLYGRLLTDLAGTSESLSMAAGSPVDFDTRAAAAVAASARSLLLGDIDAATTTLTDFLDAVSSSTPGVTGDRVESLAADVPLHMQRIAAEVEPDKSLGRWWRRRAPAQIPDPDSSRRLIAEAVIRPVRAILARRALAVASIAELGVAVQDLRRKTAR